MNTFVKGSRVASPHNGQPTNNASRRVAAANAKVSLKDATQKPQPQPQSGLPSRGFSNAQNSSAAMQHRQPGHIHGRQHDAYDTDAESLDTTVNASVVKDGNNQAAFPQHEQQDQIDDHDEDSASGDDDYDEEGEREAGGFTQDEVNFLAEKGFGDYTHEEKLNIVQSIGPSRGFPTIEGDSYPSTTDGLPTQWDGEQEPPSEDHARAVSPPRTAVNHQVVRASARQPLQQGAAMNNYGSGHASQKPSVLFQQGSALRTQQRSTPQNSQRIVSNVQPTLGPFPSSHPPTYSQANIATTSVIPVQLNSKPIMYGQTNLATRPVKRTLSNPHRMQLPRVQPMAPSVPANGREGPGSLRQPTEGYPASEASTRPIEDYDHEKLLAMRYDDLKKESFDLDPRADASVLAEDTLQKPLIERLEYVQKKLDAEHQSKFFSSLPTTEWENAGDWFLDQFQSIIQRTKEARQTKRKLAQEFEEEVEKRYKHVSKKQQQVEAAMEKMKQQGEGLVPKSPRPSKSPQTRKRGHA